MNRVITSIFLTFLLDSLYVIHSLPINNGFSVKFNAAHSKEDIKPKQLGAFFAKVPQEDVQLAVLESKRRLLSKTQYSHLGIGCTNQIARLVIPIQYNPSNKSNTNTTEKSRVLHLPMFEPPFKDYKILVATAPAHMKLGRNYDERLLVYVVFPAHEEGKGGAGGDDAFAVPTVYFFNQTSSKMFSGISEKGAPVFLVDNNRKVTKLNSKLISKYVAFKNKLSGRLV